MNDSYTIALPMTVCKVSGIMGLPASSFIGEMFAAHRIEAMLRKRVVLAILRPRQILQQRAGIMKRLEHAQERLPWSKALFTKS